MKQLFTLALCGMMALTAHAQEQKSTDTIAVITSDTSSSKSGKKAKTVIQIGNLRINTNSNQTVVTTTESPKKKNTVSVGLVFDHFDLGFSRYLDKGSFTLSQANSFLEFEPAKTSNVGFDFFEMKYKSGSKFAFYIAAGLDWNHIRLKQHITILKDQPVLDYQPENIAFSKNRLSSRYLRIPIGFEFNTPVQKGKYFRVVAGPELGFLLNGKLKQISEQRGKEKFKDDYNFNPFRYGAHLRLAYQNTGIFMKYYFSDVFAKDQGPDDFNNMSFGLTWGF
jgi:hypothetical protein